MTSHARARTQGASLSPDLQPLIDLIERAHRVSRGRRAAAKLQFKAMMASLRACIRRLPDGKLLALVRHMEREDLATPTGAQAQLWAVAEVEWRGLHLLRAISGGKR